MDTKYLTQWAEAMPVKDCTTDTTTIFIENIISRFGFQKIPTSDQGTHFINEIVESLLNNFMIQHHKSIPYHPLANETIEAFNKILKKGLTKIVSAIKDD